jgi:hypothetical protein
MGFLYPIDKLLHASAPEVTFRAFVKIGNSLPTETIVFLKSGANQIPVGEPWRGILEDGIDESIH